MFNCLWPRFFIIHSNSADRTRNLSTESELNCAVQKIKIKDKEKSEKSPASRQLTESKRNNYLSAFGSLSFCFLFFFCLLRLVGSVLSFIASGFFFSLCFVQTPPARDSWLLPTGHHVLSLLFSHSLSRGRAFVVWVNRFQCLRLLLTFLVVFVLVLFCPFVLFRPLATSEMFW